MGGAAAVQTATPPAGHRAGPEPCMWLQVAVSEAKALLFSRLEGDHSVDFIHEVGPVPVHTSKVVHIRRIVNLDLVTKPSVLWKA